MLNELAKQIHDNNIKKGFYEKEKNIGEMLALIHEEVSEALRSDRVDSYCTLDSNQINAMYGFKDEAFLDNYIGFIKGTFEEEMADIIIRVLDLCKYKAIDIEAHIYAKIRYNTLRKYKHGKKY
jgi:NTP pyrophosphatase (non-canonical NTP hydrolase)